MGFLNKSVFALNLKHSCHKRIDRAMAITCIKIVSSLVVDGLIVIFKQDKQPLSSSIRSGTKWIISEPLISS